MGGGARLALGLLNPRGRARYSTLTLIWDRGISVIYEKFGFAYSERRRAAMPCATRPDHIIINHISPHRGKRTNINTHVHATTCLAITNAIRGALPLRNAHDPIAWIYSRPRSGVAAGRSVL